MPLLFAFGPAFAAKSLAVSQYRAASGAGRRYGRLPDRYGRAALLTKGCVRGEGRAAVSAGTVMGGEAQGPLVGGA